MAPGSSAQQRWSLDSIDWRAVPRGAANPEDPLFYLVAAASFMAAASPMLSAMTLDQLGARMKCDRCGKRHERYYPANQSDAPGFVRRI